MLVVDLSWEDSQAFAPAHRLHNSTAPQTRIVPRGAGVQASLNALCVVPLCTAVSVCMQEALLPQSASGATLPCTGRVGRAQECFSGGLSFLPTFSFLMFDGLWHPHETVKDMTEVGYHWNVAWIVTLVLFNPAFMVWYRSMTRK